MNLTVATRMTIASGAPVDLLLQFTAAAMPEQIVRMEECRIDNVIGAPLAAQDGIGTRVWARCNCQVEVAYRAAVQVRRTVPVLDSVPAVPPSSLPAFAVPYLFESRYCEANRLRTFVDERFGTTTGGARIQAIHDWVATKLAYVPGSSHAETTATDTFIARQGVCRDYAHVVIAMARASDIPARFVSCYAPRVSPQDFHAVAEVFLANPEMPGGGYWHPVDATGMAEPGEMVTIGVGRDAADVSFLTSLGAVELLYKEVAVSHHDESIARSPEAAERR